MQQILHLLVLDGTGTAALVARYGARWLLPVLTCDERARAALLVGRWAAGHGIAGDVAGQWLGRMRGEAIDWLVPMRVQPSELRGACLEWMPLAARLRAPIVDYQEWALAAALENSSVPGVSGPFGSLAWLDEVKMWITATTGITGEMTPFRVGAHEVVLSAETGRRRVYFKGLTPERAVEARLTQVLAAVAPRSFARTVAAEHRPDGTLWWIQAACSGVSIREAPVVARELARLQRRVMASAPVLRELPRLDLDRCASWVSGFVRDPACAAAIHEHIDRVATADTPQSWIPLDLHPTNVLVDRDGEVRFIDLDGSFLGPAPLAAATLLTRWREARSLYEIYEQAWSPPLAGTVWRSFEVVRTVVEAWTGWQRLEQHTRSGELHGVLDFAAHRLGERLSAALQRR